MSFTKQPVPRKAVTRKFLGRTYSATLFNKGDGWVVTDMKIINERGEQADPTSQGEAHAAAQILVDATMSALSDGSIPDVTCVDAKPIDEEPVELKLAYYAHMLPGGRDHLHQLMVNLVLAENLGEKLLESIKAAVNPSPVEQLLEALKAAEIPTAPTAGRRPATHGSPSPPTRTT